MIRLTLLSCLLSCLLAVSNTAVTCRYDGKNYAIGQALPVVNGIPCSCTSYKNQPRLQCDYSNFNPDHSADFPSRRRNT